MPSARVQEVQDNGGELCGGAESPSLPWLGSCRAPVQAYPKEKVWSRSLGPAGTEVPDTGVVAAVWGTAGFIDGLGGTQPLKG